jgi:hypothetical protein
MISGLLLAAALLLAASDNKKASPNSAHRDGRTDKKSVLTDIPKTAITDSAGSVGRLDTKRILANMPGQVQFRMPAKLFPPGLTNDMEAHPFLKSLFACQRGIAAVRFRTPDGAGFSPLNHFVSELGWHRYSRMAWVYFSKCLLSHSPKGIKM